MSLPKLMIVGYGRAGKDTAGEYLGTHSLLRYNGSTSNIVCPLIAEALGISPEEAWRTRHENRQFWYEWSNEYRKDDPAKLIKKSLEQADLVIGVRDMREIKAAREQKLVNLIIWVDSNRVPKDPTVGFTKDDADLIIQNNDDIDSFYDKLERFARTALLYVPPSKRSHR